MKPPKRSKKKLMTLVCVIALLSVGILLNFTTVSDAAPGLTVNTTADTTDGACNPIGTGDGCTLREAITLANSNAGVDTITFDATVFAAPGPHVIQLTSALPDLASDIDINGPGARVLSVRGEGASDRYRIFTIPAGVTVNISGLTATNGHTADGAASGSGVDGGGILNSGTLTLTGVAVVGNRTGNGIGDFKNGGVGGGIRNQGTLTITNSIIAGNQTGDGGSDAFGIGGPGGSGAGIQSNGGPLTITNSTISGNHTGNGGTGNVGPGNRGDGGGIHNANSTLTISNCTITANSAASGGGIRRNGSTTVTLRSTIVALNSGTGPDISGNVQSDGYNLIGNTANAVINQNPGAGPDITNADPQLNALGNHGGPTDTHSLKSNSPAIDKGNAFGSTTDQRNLTRTVDLDDTTYPDAAGGDATDIGAYEVQTSDPNLFPIAVNTTADTDDGACTTIGTGNGCTLREAITLANNFSGTQTIIFDPTVFGSAKTITLGSALPEISTGMVIDGPGAAFLTVNGNDAFRVFNVTSATAVTIQDLTIRDGNAIGSDGGGIKNSSALILANAAVSSSRASNGGGVYNNGSLTTINSTFSDNSCLGTGGGIYNGGALIATNSTFSGNSTSSSGGGVFNLGVVIITNSTFSGNTAMSGGGGGVRNDNTMRLRNTIIANSTGGDCSGTATAFNSLVEDGSCSVTNGVNGNRTGVDPQLGTLTGSPAYFPLGGFSPARNAGNNFFVSEADDDGGSSVDMAVDYNGDGDTTDTLTTDQAGETRIANTTVDMGSTEVNVIVVNLTTNVSDTDTGDGICDTSADAGEQCTLRAAVQTANANAGTETIVFDPTVFAGAQTITITNGLPQITSNLTIAGTGQALLTLSGTGGATRLFLIGSGTTVTLQDFTASGASSLNGAALFNNGGTLTLNRVTFSGNTATNTASGGAVYNDGTTTVNNCIFTGNTAGGSGGAIHNNVGNTLRVNNSTFTGNTSNATGASNGGGAIYGNSTSTMYVTSSSFSGNNVPSGGYGGAIMAANSSAVITNSTINGNTAANGGGGGIYATNPGAAATIINTTISGNGAAAGLGGGIQRGLNSTITLKNSIVANSTSGSDCATASNAPSVTNSLVEDGSCSVVNGSNGNKTGDPALDTLTNGYLPLTLGSIARDAGNNNFLSEAAVGVDFNGDGDQTDTLTTDQAGAARIFNTTVDMGAVERTDVTPPQVSSIVRASVDPTNSNTSVSFTVNFTEDVTGVDATDFALTVNSLLGPTVTGVTGAGAIWTVTVNTGIGSGTVRLDLIDNDTIADVANNKLGGTGTGNGNFTGGQSYTVNATDSVTTPLVVTKTDDTNDNVCDADCSLREAITIANTDPGVETITFAPALTSAGPATINLSSALPNLSTDINISGPGAQLLTVARSSATRFRVFTVMTGVTVNISGLTVTGGFTTNGAPGQPGGGLLNSGTLTLTGVVVSGNQSGNGAGCANCTGGNGGDGGGIHNAGTLTVVNSTISGNQTGKGGDGLNQNGIGANGGSGGGINNTGTLIVINSTISNNQTGGRGTGNLGNGAGGNGGGISNGGTLTVINTTVSGNNAAENAGGVDVTGGAATIINTTITNNRADSDVVGNPSVGGGLRLSAGAILRVLRNTIVAGNFIEAGTTDTNSDISGPVDVGSSNNLVGVNTGMNGITNGSNGNQIGTAGSPINPLLGPLANNGGPTQTHALLGGSPAIEAGNNANLPLDTRDLDGDSNTGEPLPVDQRGIGFARVVDSGDANSIQTVDIGAFELQLSIEDITDKTTAEDTAVPQITFSVGSASIQSVTATSSNTFLIADANLVIGGSGSTRTLDIMPTADENSPFRGTATITVTVTATDGSTAVDTFVVTVTEVNDAPVPANDPIGDVVEDSGVNIIPFSTVLANDANDGAGNEVQQVTLTGVSNPVGGTVQINGTNIEFTPAPNYFGPASFVYTVTDDGTTNGVLDPKSGNATASFNVTAVNEPPVNTVPGPQATNQDTPLTFSSGNSNQISVADSDAAALARTIKKGGIHVPVGPSGSSPLFANLMQITLSVTNGTMTLNGTAGLNFVFSDFRGTGAGDGTADATMTFRGAIADINTALNGMFFTPTPGFSGIAVLTITSDDLGNTGTGGALTDTDTVNIQVSNDIRIQDARIAEPTSGTRNMLFTVSLTVPAGPSGLQVTYTSATGGSNPATAGSDYNNVGPTVLTFAAGQRIKTISVPVLADADTTETDETLVVTLSNPSSGTIVDGTAIGTIIHANIPSSFLISELRTSGSGGAGDDFVEFYNNSDSPLTVTASDASAGYGLFKKGADCDATPILIGVIPNGTVIPARGHYLMVGSQYSLTAYAAGNLTLSSDIESDANVAIFSTSDVGNISSATSLDAVGFGTNTGAVCDLLREGTNIPATGGPTIEYSFHRDSCGKGGSNTIMGGCTVFTPVDNNNNNPDFVFVDTQGSAIAGHPQRLGAPGPENLASPILRNTSMAALFLDQSVAPAAAPNRVRDLTPVTNGTNGTLTFRRRIQNNTGGNVTRLRFRIIDVTSFPATATFADLRALSSMNVVVSGVNDSATCLAANGVATTPCNVTVSGTTLETPPSQPNGGAWNSTFSAGTITLGTPLANGASANLQFVMGVMQSGTFKFYINIEALP